MKGCEDYSAIVLMGQPRSDAPLGLEVSDERAAKAYRKSELNRECVAESKDVGLACDLLRDEVLVIAEMVK